MRCHVCDRVLTDKEIVYNTDIPAFEPCNVCLDVIMETAYSDGFKKEEGYEEIPILDGGADDLWDDNFLKEFD